MSDAYIPRADVHALAMMQAFAAGISANPALYMLTAGQAESIQGVVDQFAADFRIAKNEATRTKGTICAKDDSRHVAEQLCRQYAMLIKGNAGITDGDKFAIGVRPVNRARTRVKCPQTSPALGILAATPGEHTLRFKDSILEGAGKPFGATELLLFVAIGDEKIAPQTDARFYRKFTKNPMVVEFRPEDDGKVATYYGQWASRRGDVGPLSLPVSMRIAA
jgi:hypothetical protein